MSALLLLWLGCDAAVDDRGPRPDRFDADSPAPLSINEIMPRNKSAWVDEAGESPDWIELYNPTADAVSLDDWSLGQGEDPDEAEPLAASLVVPAEGWLLLVPDDLGFALDGDGEQVALFAPDGSGSIVTFGALPSDVSIARIPDGCVGEDCWDYVFLGTPGRTNVPPDDEEPQVVVPRGSVWRYLDAGSAPPGWADPAFPDDGWASGPAPLGYGDPHVVTTTSYGADDQNKSITTYFRAAFALDADAGEAAVRLLRDDGAVVYLDGVEIVRDNLPEGDVGSDTLATTAVGDSAETTYSRYVIGPLTAGDHVLAVEVHQAAPTSSDLGFDLELEVTP